MPIARRLRPHPSLDERAPSRRARRPARLTSRRAELGVWRRRWSARLPIGPLLLVAAAVLALASLRLAPSDLGTDPGSAAPIVVATIELASGTVVDLDDVEVRSFPVVAIPPTSATATDQVVGRQVTATNLAGEPIVVARLAPDGLSGVAAATPPTWSSFALPAGENQPDAVVGQVVDLYALGTAPALGADPGEARRVAHEARVVATDAERVTIAVRAADAPAVAGALIGSTVVVAITGPETPTEAGAEGP